MLPEQDAVVAITSGVKDMQAVLDLVWDELLPAMKPKPQSDDEDARHTLARRLAGLSLRRQEGAGSTGASERVRGKTYHFPANERKLEAITLGVDDEADAVTFVARFDGVDRRMACGRGAWRSASPWSVSTGGSFRVTSVIGGAALAFSGLSRRGPPSSFASGASARVRSMSLGRTRIARIPETPK